MWPAVIAAGASLAGGLIGNRASAKQAAKQREWQEYMSGTAHQREVADLRAAGLNPILSATGGAGAATPSGATAKQDDVGTPAVNSALAARQVHEVIENIKADTRLKDEDRMLRSAQWNLVQDQSRGQAIENEILDEQLKGWRIEGAIDSSAFGMATRGAKRVIEPILGGSSAIRNLFSIRERERAAPVRPGRR